MECCYSTAEPNSGSTVHLKQVQGDCKTLGPVHMQTGKNSNILLYFFNINTFS